MHPALPDRDDWYLLDQGLPHPRWAQIGGWIRAMLPYSEADAAYRSAVRAWLPRLAKALGPEMTVHESAEFHLLSPMKEGEAQATLGFLEQTRGKIRELLGEQIDPPGALGKHVVICCPTLDKYFEYISHFYDAGVHPSSGGIFIQAGGYGHIVLPPYFERVRMHGVLVHELTHNLVCTLPLPAWLNEGLAMTLENTMLGSGMPLLNQELVERHRERWNSESIQEFWMGWSFQDAGDSDLAYSLAAIFLRAIQTDFRAPKEALKRFVLAADYGDGGAAAMKDHLNLEASELATTFLGPGDWAPRPDTWTGLWKAAKEREPDVAEPEPEQWAHEEE